MLKKIVKSVIGFAIAGLIVTNVPLNEVYADDLVENETTIEMNEETGLEASMDNEDAFEDELTLPEYFLYSGVVDEFDAEESEFIEIEEETSVAASGDPDYEGAKKAIKEAFDNWEPIVILDSYNIPTSAEAWALAKEVADEEPTYRFVKSGGTIWGSTNHVIRMAIKHGMSKEMYQEYKDKIYATYREMIPDEKMSDIDKALAVHDWLVYNTQYQYGNEDVSDVLFNHKAICQAYANTFCIMMDIAGIECDKCGSEKMNHVWNILKLDGYWYEIDCTWDDPTNDADNDGDRRGYVGHTHFMRSDAAFTEMGYHDYESYNGITCTSTKYENAWWLDVNSNIYMLGDTKYFIKNYRTFDEDGKVTKKEAFIVARKGEQETKLVDISNKWKVWGSTSFYSNYGVLGYDGTYFYYTTSTEIYRVEPGKTEPKLFYTYEGGDGYIYGMQVGKESITLQISKEPDITKGFYKYLPLKGNVSSVAIRGMKSAPMETTEKITLTATAVVADGKTPSYEWKYVTKDKEYTIPNANKSTYTVSWTDIQSLGIYDGTLNVKCVVTVDGDSASAQLPISYQTEGIIGKGDVKWSIDNEGTLTISGKGNIVSQDSWPWSGIKLKNVIIEDGIVDIDGFLFSYQSEVNTIILPATIGKMGNMLHSCGVKNIIFKGSAPTYMYSNTYGKVIANAYYPAGDSSWTDKKLVQNDGTITWISYDASSGSGNECTLGEHIYGEGKIVKEATEDEEGLKKFDCIICGKSKEEIIPKLEGNPDPEEDPDPTPLGEPLKLNGNSAIVKQKLDMTLYFPDAVIDKYVVTSLDTGKAVVTKKGILTAKKAGKVLITPMKKVGSKYEAITELKPVTIEILAPSFDKTKMVSTYIGEKIELTDLLSGFDGQQIVSWSFGNTTKPVFDSKSSIMQVGASQIEKTSIETIGYGSRKITATFKNGQGRTVSISKVFKVVQPKLSVKPEITMALAKKKSVRLNKTPAGRTVTWKSSDESVVKVISSETNSSKATLMAVGSGKATITATLDGQTYSVVVIVP